MLCLKLISLAKIFDETTSKIDNESNIYEIDQLYYDFKKQTILKRCFGNTSNTVIKKIFNYNKVSLIFENVILL